MLQRTGNNWDASTRSFCKLLQCVWEFGISPSSQLGEKGSLDLHSSSFAAVVLTITFVVGSLTVCQTTIQFILEVMTLQYRYLTARCYLIYSTSSLEAETRKCEQVNLEGASHGAVSDRCTHSWRVWSTLAALESILQRWKKEGVCRSAICLEAQDADGVWILVDGRGRFPADCIDVRSELLRQGANCWNTGSASLLMQIHLMPSYSVTVKPATLIFGERLPFAP